MGTVTQSQEPVKPGCWKLSTLIPLGIFMVMVVFLGIGLTMDPRLVPSPLIGKQGKIAYKHIGPILEKDWQETLLPLIVKLQKQQPSPFPEAGE